jgi:hypothetical protein
MRSLDKLEEVKNTDDDYDHQDIEELRGDQYKAHVEIYCRLYFHKDMSSGETNALLNAFASVIGPHFRHGLEDILSKDLNDDDAFDDSDLKYAVNFTEMFRTNMREMKQRVWNKIISTRNASIVDQ